LYIVLLLYFAELMKLFSPRPVIEKIIMIKIQINPSAMNVGGSQFTAVGLQLHNTPRRGNNVSAIVKADMPDLLHSA